MVPLEQFLFAIQENADRIHAYELGHDGDNGKSDCIGLIIGALKLAGFKWPGTHGSNWAARNTMDSLNYIHNAFDLFLGEVVYKAREPGEEKYELPSVYKNSPDQRDYYHVGVITSISPLEITHCTGVEGGIKRDNEVGKWRYGGKLKYVDYSEEVDQPIYRAVVMASNGYPVNMRIGPGTEHKVIAKVNIGTEVNVLYDLGAWCEIRYDGMSGYMMRKYLEKIASSELSDILAQFEKATQELKAYMEAHQ